MFEGLTERLDGVVQRLRGMHKLSEENISDALRDVRMALLEADVNVGVVKEFIAEIRELALGMETAPGLTPGQSFIKIVHERLTDLLGGETVPVAFADRGPTVILMTGLQGSGKTTTTAKLARFISKQGYTPMVVSADVYRPAAMDQLATLAKGLDLPLFPASPTMKPAAIVKDALAAMGREGANVLLIDTAGRLHIDDTLMNELDEIRRIATPAEILFVADSMTGQDAVTVAKAFHERIGMTGVILTKLDGDTRGGAALSVKKVTGAPIKFMGVGEKVEQFETFHPERMASRILGMGDVLSLIEQAQENIDQKQAEKQARKMLDASFDLNDFLDQIRMVRKMGPLDQLLKMMPGMGQAIKDAPIPGPAEIGQIEAIICSMTTRERAQPGLINTSRKRRIAAGSGTAINDVNKLLRQFQKSKKMMKSFGKMSKKMKGRPDMPNNPFGELGMGG